MKNLVILLFSLISIVNIQAQDNIIGSTALIHTTFNHISVHINIAGDVNVNSTCSIEYKEVSETTYNNSAKVMRATPDMIVDGNLLDRNHFAGSAMFLKPGTLYNIRITIIDPDNGTPLIDDIIAITKSFPQAAVDGVKKYVIPGDGGGQGTLSDPYLGLQSAADNANEGDIIIVGPGIYKPFEIRNSGSENLPITFISEVMHMAIIDGDGTDRGVVTIGDYNLSINDVIIDGFIIQNGAWGVDAQNTAYLTVQNNIIRNIDFGFVNRRENNGENDQYVFNNIFEGRTVWPQLNGEIAPERAIDIRGNNNVISYNTITDFGDGISCDGTPYQSSYSLDIYNNEIRNVVDDFIEIDGNISNTRVYNNRGFNGRMGVSLAPVFGGPVYVFRNVFYNLETSIFKMNRKPAGLVIAHNLGIKKGNGISSDVGWQNTYIKNNIIMGTRYCFEEYGQINTDTEDWDYNAYYSTRDGVVGDEWFKWQNVRYGSISDLASNTTIESHGITTSLTDLENAFMPQVYGISYNAADQDFQLSDNSMLIDKGTPLQNINIPYVTDGKPDIGPYEYGMDIPQYGAVFDVGTKVETENSNTVELFPNPSSGKVKIKSKSDIHQILIINSSGRLIEKLNDIKSRSIDISFLPRGVYFFYLMDKNNVRIGISKIVLM
ncbi:MAG: T9SS type A sorting domain-containing protein [Saprospiraceae bacterium]